MTIDPCTDIIVLTLFCNHNLSINCLLNTLKVDQKVFVGHPNQIWPVSYHTETVTSFESYLFDPLPNWPACPLAYILNSTARYWQMFMTALHLRIQSDAPSYLLFALLLLRLNIQTTLVILIQHLQKLLMTPSCLIADPLLMVQGILDDLLFHMICEH